MLSTTRHSPVYLFVMMLLMLFTLSVTTTGGLKMLALRVPAQADIRDDVKMTCEYSLGEKSLYSVKWYKDEYEFFRYMPNHNPTSQSFPAPGITLKKDPTPMTSVTLTQLSFNTSGNYRCEVSSEGPNFKTVAENQNMTVLALPKEDPLIEGILSAYSIGDFVVGNCTSAPSHPGSQLSWYINGNQAQDYILEFYPPYEEDWGRFKLISNRLGIRFQVTRHHFMTSITPGNVQLECVAFVGGRTWRRQVAPSLAKLTNQRLAQPQNTAAYKASAPYWLLYSIALVNVFISDKLYFKSYSSST